MGKALKPRRIRSFISFASALVVLGGFVASSTPSAAGATVKQYTINLEPSGSDFSLTFTNSLSSSAVLGSAAAAIPSSSGCSFTAITAGPTASNDKNWLATLVSASLIRLRAVGDGQKLAPGESVTVTFSLSQTGNCTINTAAKSSSDFSGSSFFLSGGSPTICGSGSECTATLGNPDNAAPDHLSAQVTLNDACPGCVIQIGETIGDFCADPASLPAPGSCRTKFGAVFDVDGFVGTLSVTELLTCDKSISDCPPPPPCKKNCDTSTGATFYPVWQDPNTGPTQTGDDVTQLQFPCGVDEPPPACISNFGPLEGSGDYQSTIKLILPLGGGGGGDPKHIY